MSLSYDSSGVRYDQLDAFKRACQQAARATAGALAAHGFREPAAVRGESAYLIEGDDHYLAHVEEGLGTCWIGALPLWLSFGVSVIWSGASAWPLRSSSRLPSFSV